MDCIHVVKCFVLTFVNMIIMERQNGFRKDGSVRSVILLFLMRRRWDKLFRLQDIINNRVRLFMLPKTRFIMSEIQGLKMVLDMQTGFHHQLYYKGVYEPETTRYLKNNVRKRDVFVDIGANNGYYTLLMASIGAEVYSFEPQPVPRRMLKRGLKINGLRANVSDFALDNKTGTSDFYIHKSSGTSGLYQRIGTRGRIEVKTTTLDSILDHADFVKIDVEGAEIRVLQGMERLIERCPDVRLIIEVHPQRVGFSSGFWEIINRDWTTQDLDIHNMLCVRL